MTNETIIASAKDAHNTASGDSEVQGAHVSRERAEAQGTSVTCAEQMEDSSDGDAVEVADVDETDVRAELAREGERVRRLADELSDERARLLLEREIEKVAGYFPQIRNTLDIVRLERWGEIKDMVGRGYALSDAVRLAYEDVIISRRAEAAVREARGTPSSLHIRATSPTSVTSHEVSEAQIRTYLSSVPGATRDGAIRAYQKYKIGKR